MRHALIVANTGFSSKEIEIIRNAHEAIEAGIREVNEDDLLVVIAEKVPQTLQAIRAHSVTPS